MESIDFGNFFSMALGDSRGALQFRMSDTRFKPEDLFKYNQVNSQDVILLNQVRGKKKYDFLTSGFAYLNIASSKFWNVIEKHNLIGIRSIGVSSPDLNDSEYRLCSIVGKCGPKIDSLSVQIDRPFPLDPSRTYKTWAGLYFDLKSWDGSDFFSPEGTYYTLITRRAKEVLIENKITNVSFTPITQVENFDLLLR
ncbi:hypothetical protein SanaruYs_06560 [Chryseotalea sanaruensis]|uniref:Uncharacterized protein n=1 Tax=Chryseotalea sanaruensis TaxID=2482724 RepID=A0A401U686_9BACT|nr:hypothetical protein [Chryseotalea sanaruensis]GCC50441.1 hypothetical protein SanaruYs_06560 [Chryseotalea sanaruensis]